VKPDLEGEVGDNFIDFLTILCYKIYNINLFLTDLPLIPYHCFHFKFYLTKCLDLNASNLKTQSII